MTALRIGIDVSRLLSADRSGLFTHVAGVLAGFRAAELAGRVALFYRRQLAVPPGVRSLLAGFPVRAYYDGGLPGVRRLRSWWTGFRGLDVFQQFENAVYPDLGGRVNAYHVPDLTPLRNPDWHLAGTRADWLEYFRHVAARATLVTTYSDHTRRDVIRELGVAPDRVAAVPLAGGAGFRPLPDDRVRAAVARHGLPYRGYLMTASTIEPRKNHVTLFRAYAALKARGRVGGVPLAVVGPKGWGCEPILAEIDRLGLADDVRLLGYVDDLAALYCGAAAMVYPSRYEGFGLPPLEAMACGCPVVTSNATSLPEVVGDAGLTADPDDADGFADAIGRLLADPNERSRRAAAGLQRAATFSWARHARELYAAYDRAARGLAAAPPRAARVPAAAGGGA